ncbi:hypothetical protein [Bacillus cereus]|uniref:hypothetical protein n=1 Tax=Bacillus cereus TaxID=1396 RepID=UPI00099369C7|nr:hypothetical protein [Bacillus cereus]OOQ93193.1 hypothetical protein BW898_20730 [Bacillus cereus]
MKKEHIAVEPFTFAWIVAGIASGILNEIGSEVAKPVIKDVLGKGDVEYGPLILDSLRKIEEAVKDVIVDQVIKEYISDCNYVRDQLLTYEETDDIDILYRMQDRSSQLANRLYGQGIKGFGGLLMACNLHLLTLRGIAEKDATYRNTLQRKFEDYAEWIEEVAESFSERYSTRISTACTCYFFLKEEKNVRKKITDFCDDPDNEDVYMWEYYFDWGGVRQDGFEDKPTCENHRNIRYKTDVIPSVLLYEDSIKMVEDYRNYRIEP